MWKVAFSYSLSGCCFVRLRIQNFMVFKKKDMIAISVSGEDLNPEKLQDSFG